MNQDTVTLTISSELAQAIRDAAVGELTGSLEQQLIMLVEEHRRMVEGLRSGLDPKDILTQLDIQAANKQTEYLS